MSYAPALLLCDSCPGWFFYDLLLVSYFSLSSAFCLFSLLFRDVSFSFSLPCIVLLSSLSFWSLHHSLSYRLTLCCSLVISLSSRPSLYLVLVISCFVFTPVSKGYVGSHARGGSAHLRPVDSCFGHFRHCLVIILFCVVCLLRSSRLSSAFLIFVSPFYSLIFVLVKSFPHIIFFLYPRAHEGRR